MNLKPTESRRDAGYCPPEDVESLGALDFGAAVELTFPMSNPQVYSDDALWLTFCLMLLLVRLWREKTRLDELFDAKQDQVLGSKLAEVVARTSKYQMTYKSV